MNCTPSTACYYIDLETSPEPAGTIIHRKCGNPFASVSEYRLSINVPPEDTIETLACRASGRGIEKATIPLLWGSPEKPAVLRLSVIGNAMVLVRGGGGIGNNVMKSSSKLRTMSTTGAAMDLMTRSGRRDEGEAQVIVRGVAGTSVKVAGPSFSFHADTQFKSEQVFFCKIFDIPLFLPRAGDDDKQQQQRRRTGPQSPLATMNNTNNNYSNNNNNDSAHLYTPHPSPYHSSSASPSSLPAKATTNTSDSYNGDGDGDILTRFIRPLDPIVIDPTWPSSSVHPLGWVRYTVELMTNRTMQYKSVTEIWVHNSPSPSPPSPSLQLSPAYIQGKDSDIMDGSETVVVGPTVNMPGLLLLDQDHPWNVQLPESTTTQFELGQTIPLCIFSTIEQPTETEHIRLTLVQKRFLRTKGTVGTIDTLVQELIDIALFTPSLSLEGGSRPIGLQLQLPMAPVLAPSTRTMYLDVEHSLVLSRVAPESKTKSIIVEVPITIIVPRKPSDHPARDPK